MLRTLLTRRWVTAILLALLFAVVAVALGAWQYSRHEERVTARDRVEQHYAADPLPLDAVLDAPDDAVPPEAEWTRVAVTGEYLPEETLLVRNRPLNGVYGYEVVVPLRTTVDGRPAVLLVDRGWLPNASSANMLPEVPPPPDGHVEVTGWLRPDEPSLGRDLPPGQLASVHAPEAAEELGRDLADGYLVLDAESGPAVDPESPRPEPLEAPRTDLGSHFAYALQWWLTAPVGLVLVLVMARREHRERTGAPAPRRRARIWDEEDE